MRQKMCAYKIDLVKPPIAVKIMLLGISFLTVQKKIINLNIFLHLQEEEKGWYK